MKALERLMTYAIVARRALVNLSSSDQTIFDLVDANRAARILLTVTVRGRIERNASRLMPGFLQRVSRLVRDGQSIEDELTVFLFQTQAELERIMRAAHESAMRLGHNHVRRELRELGLPAPNAPNFSTESDYLRSVIADIRGNVHAFRIQVQTLAHQVSLLPQDERAAAIRLGIWPLHRNLVLRTTQGSSVVITRASTDSEIDAYDQVDELSGLTVYKIWLANFSNNVPCPACQELHGATELLHHEFDRRVLLENGLSVYHDFQSPPAHPNCRCSITIRIRHANGESTGIDPQGLRDFVEG